MITKPDVLKLLSLWEARIEELEKFEREATPEKHPDLTPEQLAFNSAHRTGEMKAYRMAIKRLKDTAQWKGIELP